MWLPVSGSRVSASRASAWMLASCAQLVLAHAARHLGLEERVLVRQLVARALELDLRAHACQHHRRTQRLGDVVHRPQRQAALFFFGGVERGDADHRDVARQRVVAQAPHHLVAVHARHHQVEQDQVGPRVGGRQPQRRRARVGGAHRVLAHQQLAQNREVLGHIVDNEHGRHGHGPDGRLRRVSAALTAGRRWRGRVAAPSAPRPRHCRDLGAARPQRSAWIAGGFPATRCCAAAVALREALCVALTGNDPPLPKTSVTPRQSFTRRRGVQPVRRRAACHAWRSGSQTKTTAASADLHVALSSFLARCRVGPDAPGARRLRAGAGRLLGPCRRDRRHRHRHRHQRQLVDRQAHPRQVGRGRPGAVLLPQQRRARAGAALPALPARPDEGGRPGRHAQAAAVPAGDGGARPAPVARAARIDRQGRRCPRPARARRWSSWRRSTPAPTSAPPRRRCASRWPGWRRPMRGRSITTWCAC